MCLLLVLTYIYWFHSKTLCYALFKLMYHSDYESFEDFSFNFANFVTFFSLLFEVKFHPACLLHPARLTFLG